MRISTSSTIIRTTRGDRNLTNSGIKRLVGLSDEQIKLLEGFDVKTPQDLAILDKTDIDDILGNDKSTFLIRRKLSKVVDFIRRGGILSSTTTMNDIITTASFTTAKATAQTKFSGEMEDRENFRTKAEAQIDQEASKVLLSQDPKGDEDKEKDNETKLDIKEVAGFTLQEKLGFGSYGDVFKAEKIAANVVMTRAIKVLKAKNGNNQDLQMIENEISILQKCRHDNVVCLHDVQETKKHYCLILEFCGGGDLRNLITTRKSGKLSERLIKRLMQDLSAGLKCLHKYEKNVKILHRDIKPANLLLTGPLPLILDGEELDDAAKSEEEEKKRQKSDFPADNFFLKISDFGLSRTLHDGSLAKTHCGTRGYKAPEVTLGHRYGKEADIYSTGMVLLNMISGRRFEEAPDETELTNIVAENGVSEKCRSLLELCLKKFSAERSPEEFFKTCDIFVKAEANPRQEGSDAMNPTNISKNNESDGHAEATTGEDMQEGSEAEYSTDISENDEPSEHAEAAIGEDVHSNTTSPILLEPVNDNSRTELPVVGSFYLGGASVYRTITNRSDSEWRARSETDFGNMYLVNHHTPNAEVVVPPKSSIEIKHTTTQGMLSGTLILKDTDGNEERCNYSTSNIPNWIILRKTVHI